MREYFYPYEKGERKLLLQIFELLGIKVLDEDAPRKGRGGEFLILASKEDPFRVKHIFREVQESRALK